MKLTPGDRICILLDGAPVDTEIDDHGTQRFIQNDVIDWLIRSGQIDLNKLWVDYYTNTDCTISREALMEFYQAIGYSVCGFDEVFGPSSSFVDNGNVPCEILNPVWEQELVTEH